MLGRHVFKAALFVGSDLGYVIKKDVLGHKYTTI